MKAGDIARILAILIVLLLFRGGPDIVFLCINNCTYVADKPPVSREWALKLHVHLGFGEETDAE